MLARIGAHGILVLGSVMQWYNTDSIECKYTSFFLLFTVGALYPLNSHAQALVTPLGALFWSIFDTDSCGAFLVGPHANSLTYFSIPGILLMVPAIFIYNLL